MTTLKINTKGKTKMMGIAPIDGTDKNSIALQAAKENIEVLTGVRGDPLDQAITYRALIDQGIVELTRSSISIGGLNTIEIRNPTDPDDLTPPPTPTGLAVNASVTELLISWDQILLNNYANYSHTEVFRYTSDVIGNAIIIGTTSGAHWTDSVGYNQQRWYWVRHVSKNGIKSPYFPAVNGVSATTLQDVGAVMAGISETINDLPGYSTLISTTIPNLIDSAGASSTEVIRSTSAPTTRIDGSSALLGVDVWIDTDDNNQAYVRNSANNGWVKARDSSLVTIVGSTSYTGSSLTDAIATAQSNISTVTSTASSASTSVTNLSALVGSGNDSGGTAYSSTNTVISHVTATDQNSSSSYVLQTDANGSVAQMILHSEANAGSNPQSVITFRADTFSISNNSSTDVFPFIVDGGVTYMDIARIKDGDIQNAKIGSLNAGKINAGTLSADRIAVSSLNFDKLVGNTVSIAEAQITNSAVTNAKIADAAINTAKVGSLYANTLSGDVAKAVAGSLASTVSYANRSSTWSSAMVELELPKPTHSGGWKPYAHYNLNKVSTEKNSWAYVSLEMAAWNVNSQGTTANEAASTSSSISAYGSGYDGSAIIADFLTGVSGTGTPNTNALNFTPSHVEGVVANMIVTDGTNERTVTGNATVLGTAVVGYSGSNVAAWDSTTNFTFKESIASGSIGEWVQVAEIQWIAVDTAYNDYSISGTYTEDGSSIDHGVKARIRIKGQSSGVDQGNTTEYIYAATGFLMGVR